MINNIEDFFQVLNDMLDKYNVKVDKIGSQQNGIVAYFNTQDKQIYINKHNKYMFNDYVRLLEVAMHEETHRINDNLGKEDTKEEGSKQVHTKQFNDMFRATFGLSSKVFNGLVDFKDKENQDTFEMLVKNKIADRNVFKEIQKYFLENIYEYKEDNEGDQVEESNDTQESEKGTPSKESKESQEDTQEETQDNNQDYEDLYEYEDCKGIEL